MTAPALLLQGNGELGGALTDDGAARGLAALPNGRHTKFDHVGHNVRDGDPLGTLRIVEGFLAEFVTG